MIYYSAASSSLKKQKDLKGILSDDSCFSVERRVIFPLRNVKCKDYVSCQVVTSKTTHLRLICIRRMKLRGWGQNMDQGSMDPHFGPGPWTTFMDRVHGHFFLINENWTTTEIEQNKISQDAVHKYLVVLTYSTCTCTVDEEGGC